MKNLFSKNIAIQRLYIYQTATNFNDLIKTMYMKKYMNNRKT